MENEKPVYAIMSLDERRMVLSQIARGTLIIPKPVVVNKEVQMIDCLPDCSLRESAIIELNKMEGVYTKTAQPERERVHIIRPQLTEEEEKTFILESERRALEQKVVASLDVPAAASIETA
jgi:hypothetical protein